MYIFSCYLFFKKSHLESLDFYSEIRHLRKVFLYYEFFLI